MSLKVLESFDSDHYPILAILTFKDTAHPTPNPELDVRKEAQEKIAEGLQEAQNDSER